MQVVVNLSKLNTKMTVDKFKANRRLLRRGDIIREFGLIELVRSCI